MIKFLKNLLIRILFILGFLISTFVLLNSVLAGILLICIIFISIVSLFGVVCLGLANVIVIYLILRLDFKLKDKNQINDVIKEIKGEI